MAAGRFFAAGFLATRAGFDFPSGTATYHAHAVLDDLRSNDLEIAITRST